MCIQAKKNVHRSEKYVHSAEKSVHLGKLFKLNFSKRALRGDFYKRKSVTHPNRAVNRIVHLAGVHLVGCYCTYNEVVKFLHDGARP